MPRNVGLAKAEEDNGERCRWMRGRERETGPILHLAFQSRGSDNPNTGPIRDHSSFTSNRVTGAFAYIDASPPRRPNDVAQIVSEEFTATGANRKMRMPLFRELSILSIT